MVAVEDASSHDVVAPMKSPNTLADTIPTLVPSTCTKMKGRTPSAVLGDDSLRTKRWCTIGGAIVVSPLSPGAVVGGGAESSASKENASTAYGRSSKILQRLFSACSKLVAVLLMFSNTS